MDDQLIEKQREFTKNYKIPWKTFEQIRAEQECEAAMNAENVAPEMEPVPIPDVEPVKELSRAQKCRIRRLRNLINLVHMYYMN